MTDVLDTVRRADEVRRATWSASPEGRAVRERVFSALPDAVARSRQRRATPAIVAAALVAVLVAGAALLVERSSDGPAPAGAPTMRQIAHGTWRTLRDPMLADLPDPVSVWTGRELLIWSTGADRGVAFDPRSERWTAIPPSGVVDGQRPVWVDGRMVVWAGATIAESLEAPAPGAAYDPDAGRWTPITSAPVRPRPDGGTFAVAAGDALVVLGADVACPRDANCDTTSRDAAEYRPASGTWRMLPAWVELSALPEWAGWDGQRIVAVSSQQTTWALEPGGDHWTLLDVVPFRYGDAFALRFPDQLVSVGMVVGSNRPGDLERGVNWRALGLAHGAATWSDVGPAFEVVVLGGVATRVGDFVVVVGQPSPGRSGVLDVEHGGWRRLPESPGPVLADAGGVAWTGKQILGLRFRSGRASAAAHTGFYDLAVYTPGR